MSKPDWRDLALKTSALGSRPDSIACTLSPKGETRLQARHPCTPTALVSQVFQVATPFTLPENERSKAPAFKPISACAKELTRARAAARASEIVLCFITYMM